MLTRLRDELRARRTLSISRRGRDFSDHHSRKRSSEAASQSPIQRISEGKVA